MGSDAHVHVGLNSDCRTVLVLAATTLLALAFAPVQAQTVPPKTLVLYDAPAGTLCEGSLLDDLYPRDRWRRVEISMSKASASASGKAKRATEVLLINDAGIAA